MKQTVFAILAVVAMAVASCNSDRNNNGTDDTMMTDSSMIDTSTVVPIDTLGTDTTMSGDGVPM